MRLRENRVGLATIIVVWLIFFCRTLTGQSVYFLDDLKIIFYPLETVYAQFQHQWQLPQWSPLFGMGQPLLGWGQLGFFTPLHVLLRALWVPPLTLLQISIVTYFLIGMLGMFAWLRSHRLSQAAATLGAVTFGLSGFFIGHLNHVNFYTATLLLPSLLLAIHWWLKRPTARSTAVLSLVAASIVLSGQPQVILYTYIIAGLYGLFMAIQLWPRPFSWPYLGRRVGWIIVGAIIAVALSSLAILPLKEFLPLTERADALSEEELLDFSYPPEHAITLIFPYFFGDHTIYWGAKNFQELAAYVGIIPLLLGGAALFYWRDQKTLRLWAGLLVIIGIVFALGKYSVVYTYLVEHKLLTTLAIAGRFVYFFDVGVAALAALGLDSLLQTRSQTAWSRLLMLIGSLLLLVGLWYPFALYMQSNAGAQQQLSSLTAWSSPYFIVLIISALSFLIAPWLPKGHLMTAARYWLLGLTAVTLLILGWNYNPLAPTAQAYASSPFIPTLQAISAADKIPPRLYASEHLPVTGNQELTVKDTEPISPTFTILQPFKVTEDPLQCIHFQASVEAKPQPGEIKMEVLKSLNTPALATSILTTAQVAEHSEQNFCFPAITNQKDQDLILRFSSEKDSGIRLQYLGSDTTSDNVYFIRPLHPTPEQVQASRKPAQLVFQQSLKPSIDLEQQLLERHLQVLADTSGVRWIGALSIQPYRTWIEEAFANDRDPFDGDGVHALTRHRSLVDLTGIDYFTQSLPADTTSDPMLDAGYTLVQQKIEGDQMVRLYHNPRVFPRAFLMRNALFQPVADEVRHALEMETVDPKQVLFVDGPTPPTDLAPITKDPTLGTATITNYQPTRVDIAVDAPQDAWLVLTESSTPQWHTYIDGQEAPYYTADTFFRTARLTAGKHTVSFRFVSPAIQKGQILTLVGLLMLLILLAAQPITSRLKRK